MTRLLIDLTGKTFGLLTVIELAGRSRSREALWRCRCSCCGRETIVPGSALRSGHTRSCGRRDRLTAEQFWQKVNVGAADECWHWLGRRDAFGYGCVGWQGKKCVAHRVAFELCNGPIPDGQIVRHACDVARCVNPAHLRLGTHLDNAHDRDSRGRHWVRHGEQHYVAKLTVAQVREIRRLPSLPAGRELRRIHGVSKFTVYDARAGRTWKHVPMTEAA
jgi:hypothetical protein